MASGYHGTFPSGIKKENKRRGMGFYSIFMADTSTIRSLTEMSMNLSVRTKI
jgi:hypothetical protein